MRLYIRLSLLALVLLLAGCEDKKSKEKATETEVAQKPKDSTAEDKAKAQNEKLKKKPGSIIESQAELIPFLTEYGKQNPENRVRITTKYGDIEIQLYRDTPLHRANFILLVKQGYFEDTMIHRNALDFVVQGGNSDGYETPRKRMRIGNYLIPNEASANHTHVRGAFSAAKYTEQNISDASSPFEWFIVVPERGAHHLDGEHTVFGRVTKGMDVVDRINKVEVDDNEWPIENIYLEKVELIK
ncbi:MULTISPECIES: peptidylprolyl isomerase [unclassified Leeuwenhoekiella]|nr:MULTISPECIES: peptidylprolyl isomerase [unclassified Leeuwenhoekiella]MAW95166.1 peptidylprolyl isomerase [Leeuwenhoekiella sp.]MBA81911.1 peptidylprolyl isomerase [Leeuwenhoekiella sp.]|tara:strand:+ start:27449 stop:28177 length:729 start_codon:yes stop_codon:yes gene_type:complete